MEKTVGENANQCRHDEKQYGGFEKKLKIELPYDPAILLLGMYLKTINHQLKRYMTPNVHRSTIYNRQDLEAS